MAEMTGGSSPRNSKVTFPTKGVSDGMVANEVPTKLAATEWPLLPGHILLRWPPEVTLRTVEHAASSPIANVRLLPPLAKVS